MVGAHYLIHEGPLYRSDGWLKNSRTSERDWAGHAQIEVRGIESRMTTQHFLPHQAGSENGMFIISEGLADIHVDCAGMIEDIKTWYDRRNWDLADDAVRFVGKLWMYQPWIQTFHAQSDLATVLEDLRSDIPTKVYQLLSPVVEQEADIVARAAHAEKTIIAAFANSMDIRKRRLVERLRKKESTPLMEGVGPLPFPNT